jgi:hypothetical protein
MIKKTSFEIPAQPHGVLEIRHYLPHRMRLKLISGDSAKGALISTELGAKWHQKSNSIIVNHPTNLNTLAETISEYGWWLTAPTPIPKTNSHNLLEQISLELGANLIGASLGGALGGSLGSLLIGPVGTSVGSFLGLVIGAVAATEGLNKIQNQNNLQSKSTNAKKKIASRVAGRIGEEAGALAGLRIGGLIAGPIGAGAGALIGSLLLAQLGEDAALQQTKQWRKPITWLEQTGKAAAGEATSQTFFGIIGGALLKSPGKKTGEKLGLYLGRRINWQNFSLMPNNFAMN